MKKDEIIARYGIAAYEKMMKQNRAWSLANPEKVKGYRKRYSAKRIVKVRKIWKKYKAIIAIVLIAFFNVICLLAYVR